MINLPNSHIANITKKNIMTKYNKKPNIDRRGYNKIHIPAKMPTNIKKIKPTKKAFMFSLLK